MKRRTKIFIIILITAFILCCIDFRPWLYEKQREYLNRVDETRKEHGIGTCYDMEKSLCYYIVFINDDESRWNDDEKSFFIERKFLPSLNFIAKSAESYGAEAETRYTVCNITAEYDGFFEADTVTNGGQQDIFTQTASSLGYETPKDMNDALKKELKVKQVAYLLVVNKEGRSYKQAYSQSSIERKYEFSVFFDDSVTVSGNSCSSTVAHEILHLFGAEDLYDPYGRYPQREKLAQELFPEDIMNKGFSDINDAVVGEYTAYSVGWTDELPEECNRPEWWK